MPSLRCSRCTINPIISSQYGQRLNMMYIIVYSSDFSEAYISGGLAYVLFPQIFTIFAEGGQDHVAAFPFVLIQIEWNRALGTIMDIIPRKDSGFQIDMMSSFSPHVKPVLIGWKGCLGGVGG